MTSQTADVDFDSLERSVFRRALSHGLIDLAIGCVLVVWAVGPYTTSLGLGDFWGTAVFLPFWALAAIVLRVVHRRCVVPRLGYVQFARPRRKRLLTFNVVMLLLGTIALVAGFVSGSQFGVLPPIFHLAAVEVFVVAGFALAGYYLELHRLYAYAVVIASAPVSGELLWKYAGVPHHGYPVTFGFAAALCLTVGIVLLVRFTSRYPLPPRDSNARGV